MFNRSVMKNQASEISRVYRSRVVKGILFVLFATCMVGNCLSQQMTIAFINNESYTMVL